MQKEINQSWFFKQTLQEVWEYLTKPELIEQWLMKTDFQPIPGHKFCFTFTPKTDSKYDAIVECEVLEVKPFSKLSYSWNGSSNSGNRTFNSKVVWILVPKENGTELHLQHNGFILLEDVFNHTNGWNTCLKRFEELINTIKK
jgi:uncharacterized protein YndB with AHSA1/START domain